MGLGPGPGTRTDGSALPLPVRDRNNSNLDSLVTVFRRNSGRLALSRIDADFRDQKFLESAWRAVQQKQNKVYVDFCLSSPILQTFLP